MFLGQGSYGARKSLFYHITSRKTQGNLTVQATCPVGDRNYLFTGIETACNCVVAQECEYILLVLYHIGAEYICMFYHIY